MTRQEPVSLTVEQKEALKAYRAKNGRSWKSKLCRDWMYCAGAPELIQVRNRWGSRALTVKLD